MTAMRALRIGAKKWLYGRCPGFAGRFPYFGTSIHFPIGSEVFKWVCEQGVYEREITQLLTGLARPGTWFMDVGANIGLHSVPVLAARPTCHVVSFEPSPNSWPYLTRTVEGSAYKERWHARNVAIVEKGGAQIPLFVSDAQHAVYEGLRSSGLGVEEKTVLVDCASLDEEWEKLGEPDVSVVKVDVEGGEAQVLEGAARLIERCRPALILEWYARYLDKFDTSADYLFRFAADRQYKICALPEIISVDDLNVFRAAMIRYPNYLLVSADSAVKHGT